MFALPSDLLFLRSRRTKGERKDDAQQRQKRRSYLSDINPHTFYSVITIIMMMIEIHKQQWFGEGNLCEAYETNMF